MLVSKLYSLKRIISYPSTTLFRTFHTSPLIQGSRINPLVTPSNPTKYYILEYLYDAKTIEELTKKRTPLRVGHLGYAAKAAEKGHLVIGGACTDNGIEISSIATSSKINEQSQEMKGILVFNSLKCTRNDVIEYAKSDPYYTGGLVSKFTIREWTVVLDALTTP